MNAGDANHQAERWLRLFGEALVRNDIDAAASMFDADCYWRDVVSFTWNIKTCEGRDEIRAMLAATLAATKPAGWALRGDAIENGGATEAWFTFETSVARGKGHLRLRDGKCWTLLTTVQALKGFEEKSGAMAPVKRVSSMASSRTARPGSNEDSRSRSSLATCGSRIA